MPEELEFTIPQSLMNKVDISDVYRNYNNRGTPTSFGIDLNFFELGLSKSIKSSDFYLLRGKIESTLQSWEKIYQRHIDTLYKEDRSTSVDGMNEELQSTINILNNILSHTLEVDDTVDWDILKRNDAFRIISGDLFDGIDKPDYIEFNSYGRPVNFQKLPIPRQPSFEHIKNSYGFFTKTFRTSVIQKDYEKRVSKWKSYREQVEEDNKQREELYNKITAIYKIKKEEFKKERKHDNDTIEAFKLRYENADPEAIEEYSDLVLSNSTYPDLFPRNWTLEYRPENHMIVVDYDLPSPDHLPEVESYRYIKSRDEISEKKLTDTTRKKLYDSVIYQICIRTIHELFEADITNAIETAAFNGIVTHINPATGQKETKVIISVSANKAEFETFDLSQIDPKSTFKFLKGVSASTLFDLTPIPPVIKIEKSDKRFIERKDVAHQIDKSINLAAMDWEDFEHLVGEIFEKEFASNGGEIRVTQASSDGGVDAIAFDPDPIRGGKIVIQAKRYTNIVGVAAVRDLYGTVMNEGAIKGILVTTSDYGKDSYEFAKDKPLTLLNGSNLLSLLEKHGHRARINIAEAKKLQRT